MPAFRWPGPRREPEKEFAYFLQRETGFSRALHYSEAKKHTVVVATSAVLSHRRRENADLFVVTNGGGAQTKCTRDIGNGQVLCHSGS